MAEPQASPNAAHPPDAIFDALPEPLAVVDAAARIVRVNAAWRAAGVALPGLGDGVAEVHAGLHQPDEVVTQALEGVQRILERRETIFRQQFAHDGGHRWTELTVVPLDEGDGQHKALLQLSDVTDRKVARDKEAALRESEARFRGLADMSSDWYWQQDAQLRFTFFSGDDATSEVPYRDATVGKTPWELPDRTPLQGTWADHQAVLAQRLPFKDFVYVYQPLGQVPTYFSVNGHPIYNAAGEFAGYRGTASDITAAKTAQLEITALNAQLEDRVARRTRQLELANNELQAFAYSVAHDLRGPLISINGYSHLVERFRGTGPDDEARRSHAMSRIRAVVQQMDELTGGLLALAQLSRVALQPVPLDMGALAQRVYERLAEREPARLLTFNVQPGLLAHGDRVLVTQLLDNLIGNAWKFTARRADAMISLALETDAQNGEHFVVRDNGVGFEAARATRLFTAFQRFHKVEEFPGTGVGLATVHRIVTRHGGRIWARSVPGEGAEFCFTLAAPPPA